MASPQKEQGFTAIANELIERLSLAPISGSEFRVLCVVLRKTYGYKKKDDWISYTQFERSTALKRANVWRSIKSLVAKRLLLTSKKGYRFNKNWEEWVVAKRLPSSQTATVVANRLPTKETIQKKDTHASRGTMKKNTFGKYREDQTSDHFEEVLDLDSGERRTHPKSTAGASMKSLLDWAVAERKGQRFLNIPKQYKAMAIMRKGGISPVRVRGRWKEMALDPFWSKTGFDFMDVAKSFDRKA